MPINVCKKHVNHGFVFDGVLVAVCSTYLVILDDCDPSSPTALGLYDLFVGNVARSRHVPVMPKLFMGNDGFFKNWAVYLFCGLLRESQGNQSTYLEENTDTGRDISSNKQGTL